jgi:cytochrome P450
MSAQFNAPDKFFTATFNAGTTVKAPESDYDPYTDSALLNPWPGYRELRDAGPAVWLPKYEMVALTRHASVRNALRDWSTFASAYGVMMNDPMNQVLRGNTLCSDGADHDALRRVVIKPLRPQALTELTEEISRESDKLVERVVTQGSFDAAVNLAHHLPLTIVSTLVGLPEEGRERLLVWASALFNCIGPLNERTISAFPVVEEMVEYATTQAVRGKLKPGSWGEALHDAADRGEVPREAVPVMMVDYMGPSLDTTIFAITSAVWLFAQHPDQWDLVRENLKLISSAVNEVLRMEAPIQDFSRYAVKEFDMDGVTLPAGSRAIVFYGAANRDEREYPDPDRFDVRRNPTNHMAFGTGPHVCLGQYLARLEMTSLFTALARRVRRFELGDSERALHNILRGFTKLHVTVS